MKWSEDYVTQAGVQNRMIPGFNVFGHEDAQAVIRAAECAEQPVLLMVNRDARKDMELEHWAALLGSLASAAAVPVGIHLDHCSDLTVVRRAIEAGFTSVMYDGSKLPLDQNVSNTIQTCAWAHAKGVLVEAELGTVPYDELGETEIRFTSPREAEIFCKQARPDWLAVSVGNVHRLMGRKVQIDFTALHKIASVCTVPLVIHGASGLQEEDFPHLCASRVGKINVGTALRRAFGQALREEVIKNPTIYDRQQLFQKPSACVEETAYQIMHTKCQNGENRRQIT